MATIRAFTTIEQSRMLAEILPLETADMHYGEYCVSGEHYPIPNCDDDYYGQCCWSLAALLDVLPKIGAEEPMVRKLYYANEPKERYICEYSLTNITNEYNNPVDACYEMIIRLNELKML